MAGPASASGSVVCDQPTELVAGDRLSIKAQMRDRFGNNAPLSAPEADMEAVLQTPAGTHTLSLKSSSSAHGGGGGEHAPAAVQKSGSKKNNVAAGVREIGLYELISQSELVLKGPYEAVIKLHGEQIAGSPVSFQVLTLAQP